MECFISWEVCMIDAKKDLVSINFASKFSFLNRDNTSFERAKNVNVCENKLETKNRLIIVFFIITPKYF
jgi:hypothetical protein